MITHTQRSAIIETFLKEQCYPVMEVKGRDYAGTDHQPDVNANFKRAAERWGVPVLAAWGIYFGKHIDAIETYVRTGGQAESEPILGRITDAVNYLFILLALIERSSSGLGQRVDVSLLDTVLFQQMQEMTSWFMRRHEIHWERDNFVGAFQTADGWVTIVGLFRPEL